MIEVDSSAMMGAVSAGRCAFVSASASLPRGAGNLSITLGVRACGPEGGIGDA